MRNDRWQAPCSGPVHISSIMTPAARWKTKTFRNGARNSEHQKDRHHDCQKQYNGRIASAVNHVCPDTARRNEGRRLPLIRTPCPSPARHTDAHFIKWSDHPSKPHKSENAIRPVPPFGSTDPKTKRWLREAGPGSGPKTTDTVRSATWGSDTAKAGRIRICRNAKLIFEPVSLYSHP